MPLYPALSLTVGVVLVKLFKEERAWIVKGIFIFIMFLHVHYMNLWNQDYSRPIKGMAQMVIDKTPVDKMTYLYQYHESPAYVFYVGRRTAYLDTPEALLTAIANESEFYMLIREEHYGPMKELLEREGVVAQGSFENMYLVAKRA